MYTGNIVMVLGGNALTFMQLMQYTSHSTVQQQNVENKELGMIV